MEQRYPTLETRRLEIYNNRSNLQLLNRYFERYSVPENQRAVPTIFISSNYLIGYKEISEHLEEKIFSLLETGCRCLSLEEEAKDLTPISLLAVTGAALADSINPCAFTVLIFLLSLLSSSNEKRRLIQSSVAFMTSIYIAYFLFGVGLLSTLQITGLSYYYKLIGILAIIIGLLNIKDYFWYGRLGFVMEVPQRLKPRYLTFWKR